MAHSNTLSFTWFSCLYKRLLNTPQPRISPDSYHPQSTTGSLPLTTFRKTKCYIKHNSDPLGLV
uniref:Uncharacterized protein n=1 Tax=Medicago truncatula TaxID=3880 RepID=Q1RU56_MEDTR|nr:hypothetical protein MtrDRAFT_AC153125g11v2 [Medicago truncatula]